MFKVLGRIDESSDLAEEDNKVEALVDKYAGEVEKSLDDGDGKRKLSDEEKDEMYDWIADNMDDGDVDVGKLKEHMQNFALSEDDDDWTEEDEENFRRDVYDETIGDLMREEDDLDESEETKKDGGEGDGEVEDDGEDVEKTLREVRKALKDAIKKVNKALNKKSGKPKKSDDEEGDEAKDGKSADIEKDDGSVKDDRGEDGKKDVEGATDFDKLVVKAGKSKGGTEKDDFGSKPFDDRDDGESGNKDFGLIDEGGGERTVSDVCGELSNLHKKSERLIEKMGEVKGGEDGEKIRHKIASNLRKVSNKITRLNSELKDLCSGEDE